MKVDALKKLIKEAVREAIKEELETLQDSKPVVNTVKEQAPAAKKPLFNSSNPLAAMLNQTAASMTNEDFDRTISYDSTQARSFSASPSGAQPGLDLSQLDFTKKAGAILRASNEKDKQRHGV
jgi:hypothetical protein